MTRPFALFCLALFWVTTLVAPAGERSFDGWPRTDFSRSQIDLQEIRSGGPPKDGIPAVDAPRFDTVEIAQNWLHPDEPVIAVHLNDVARAYPLQILVYHEIVNDHVSGQPLAITFCPLCNSAVAFGRRLRDRLLDFGTTGLLRNSDMVMYDRQTESWWQQFTGRSIVGELAGEVLKTFSAPIVSFADFKAAFPTGQVLNRETGHTRPYGSNPYRGYDSIEQTPFLFDGEIDSRLSPMARVLSVEFAGVRKVYPLSELRKQQVINDTVGELPVVVLSRNGMLSALDRSLITRSRKVPAATAWQRSVEGRPLHFEQRNGAFFDRETGSRWNLFGQAIAGSLRGSQLLPATGGVHFAFAWLAFNPNTEIYRAAIGQP